MPAQLATRKIASEDIDVDDTDTDDSVIGSGIGADRACGIGVREDASLVTHETSRFVSHAIV